MQKLNLVRLVAHGSCYTHVVELHVSNTKSLLLPLLAPTFETKYPIQNQSHDHQTNTPRKIETKNWSKETTFQRRSCPEKEEEIKNTSVLKVNLNTKLTLHVSCLSTNWNIYSNAVSMKKYEQLVSIGVGIERERAT